MEELLACPVCGIFLSEPYIQCLECINPSRYFCLPCFSKGKEYENHKNSHSYTIKRNNFSILDSDWLASEELKLLNAIADYGLGNWSEVAKHVASKNKVECEEHYFKYFVCNSSSAFLEQFFQNESENSNQHTAVACLGSCTDPPRPAIVSSLYQDMAGYMPARGDFSFEHDNFAELDIKELNFEEGDSLWNDLQLSVLDIYQSRLKERARRKWLIRQYGLLSTKRVLDDCKRYAPLGMTFMEHMKALMHLFAPQNYDKFLEGLLWEHKTKQRIRLLQECRSEGITRSFSISTYMKLKRRREEQRKSKSALDEALAQIKDEVSCHNYIRKQCLNPVEMGPGRKCAPPLNIAAMPGFEKLTDKERELCSSLRVVPAAFLQYQTTLMNEYRKLGSLKLANARSVIKIDVNKTRKIYDLLLEEGLITRD